jgi:hypothetical protein
LFLLLLAIVVVTAVNVVKPVVVVVVVVADVDVEVQVIFVDVATEMFPSHVTRCSLMCWVTSLFEVVDWESVASYGKDVSMFEKMVLYKRQHDYIPAERVCACFQPLSNLFKSKIATYQVSPKLLTVLLTTSCF